MCMWKVARVLIVWGNVHARLAYVINSNNIRVNAIYVRDDNRGYYLTQNNKITMFYAKIVFQHGVTYVYISSATIAESYDGDSAAAIARNRPRKRTRMWRSMTTMSIVIRRLKQYQEIVTRASKSTINNIYKL